MCPMRITVRRAVLKRIADVLPGGTDALATYLQVSSGELCSWIDGVMPVPDAVFLKAVDLHAMRALPERRAPRAKTD
jgi:hypothetical protein